MKNNIRLDIDHNNAKRMEFFLNNIEEHLIEIAFDWHSWHLSDRIEGGYKFRSASDKPVTITTLLCDSYEDAIAIAKANALPVLPTAKWGLNGDFLYVVESNDEEKVSEICSFFAGKE
ncbi:MAG TPA: hypothetical protein VK718_06640 [Ferruginibacter sp.]|jgi:hypothetical protein|nr:hypothetical protein [Ferruginibacter sp.]